METRPQNQIPSFIYVWNQDNFAEDVCVCVLGSNAIS